MYFFISTGVLEALIPSNLPKLHRDIPELNSTDKYWQVCQRHCYWSVDQRGTGFLHVQTCPRQQCVSFLQVPTLPTILNGKNRGISSGTWVWITMPWEWVYPICLHLFMITWVHVQVWLQPPKLYEFSYIFSCCSLNACWIFYWMHLSKACIYSF